MEINRQTKQPSLSYHTDVGERCGKGQRGERGVAACKLLEIPAVFNLSLNISAGPVSHSALSCISYFRLTEVKWCGVRAGDRSEASLGWRRLDIESEVA